MPSGVAVPFLVQYLFDEVLPGGDGRLLLWVAVAMVGLTLFSGVVGYVQSLISIALQSRVRFRVTRDLFAHVLRLPVKYFDHTETGYLMSRVRDDVAALNSLMLDEVVTIAFQLAKVCLFLTLLVVIDPVLAFGGATLVALLLGVVLIVSPALRRRSERARESDARSSAALHEALTGIRSVRIAAQERQERTRFLATAKNATRQGVRRDVLGAFTASSFALMGVLGVYVIVAIGAYRIAAGTSTYGNLLAFFMFLMQLALSSGHVLGFVPAMQRSLASLDRIFRFLEEPPEHESSSKFLPTTPPRGAIEFQGVSVRYRDEGGPALADLDLVVRPGEVLALVGRSGAGKSTLVHLLPRLYDPVAGQILLDGRALADYPLRWLRSHIGVVPQDVFLFNRSVRENISYATPGATEEDIRQAAMSAHAHDFIGRLPSGYDTIVGERGVRFSGGEKQRLAIAREILRDPPILILDEATSSLDAESDALVQAAIRKLLAGRTCLVIAHRLATIQDADRIAVLGEGRLVALGTHADLLTEGGIYRELYKLQFLDGGDIPQSDDGTRGRH